jgi:hypothetical protein
MGYDRFFRESRPSSTLSGIFCSNQPDALDAFSTFPRPRGVSISVECVKFVELIWGFIFEGVVPTLVLDLANRLPEEILGTLIKPWDRFGENSFEIDPCSLRVGAWEQISAGAWVGPWGDFALDSRAQGWQHSRGMSVRLRLQRSPKPSMRVYWNALFKLSCTMGAGIGFGKKPHKSSYEALLMINKYAATKQVIGATCIYN